MPGDTTPPIQGETDANFSSDELALLAEVRSWLEIYISDFDAQMKHRVLLGTASELIDAAADLAAEHRPGMRVVELGLLAERVSQLACTQYDEDGD